MNEFIEVEVVYALPQQQDVLRLSLPEGATAREAVEASGLLLKYPDIDPGGRNKLGIYARPAKPDTVLRDRDRVEIYRPLLADPKAVRKKRAEDGKAMKKGGGQAQDA
ncbi:MAG: RnfH family protein [Azoarcus sp.]|jgi:putative ubiquitin-RnfH superfamily antitoxin RatB of RatAB toxin-antitoxin module|nr:RnfH family protein [Azoarcus sp.]